MAHPTLGEALASEAELLRALSRQLLELQKMGLSELKQRFADLFGLEAKSKNLPFLRRKLAFRLQERLEGGLSPQARERLAELTPSEIPLPSTAPSRPPSASVPPIPQRNLKERDPRLPPPGFILEREYKGISHEIEILDRGFRYRGRTYTSLSTIAKEITGVSWSGFAFFGLNLPKGKDSHGQA